MFEGFPGPGSLQRAQRLRRSARPFAHGDIEHVELALDISVREYQIDPAPAQKIDDGEVLGQSQRIMERGDHRRKHEAHVFGARGHRGRHRNR